MEAKDTRTTPVCLTVAGLDPSGGAGVAADIKTFSAFGCYAASAVTSITFQNTQGVYGAEHQSPESVRQQLVPIFDDFDVAAVKTGMLPTKEIIEVIAEVLSERNAVRIVVDPVVRSTSGFDLIDDAALENMIRTLLPMALIVTPNLLEAERIAGHPIRSESDFTDAARIMLDFGANSVLIKGGHFESNAAPEKAIDRLFNEKGMRRFENEFIQTTSTHGTGCTLSAAICANLALGLSVEESVSRSKEYVTEAIAGSQGLGKGNSPVDHWAGVKIRGER
ncbi:MAG: bifunctional hydroxymethylpyrimidine kinase/phosphomethylpyrimidine kinase [Acidobacteriota bacterium]|nr:bifunctional hydroxymethylpyrimidine kinase/phosphomethylpyrimidine kinase [Acidobacteriota bacterium]MDH3529859.1 bifunctional hydroxymethylpyrimidine kinase/phosphomethylpyrimidine kinase [Acidobacteriota bacterium]